MGQPRRLKIIEKKMNKIWGKVQKKNSIKYSKKIFQNFITMKYYSLDKYSKLSKYALLRVFLLTFYYMQCMKEKMD